MRFLLHVMSRCTDPARLDEFTDWYENIHIPDVLELPEFIRATRYELAFSPEGESPQFLAIWEVESDDDVQAVRERMLAHIRMKGAAGRLTVSDTFELAGPGLSWYRCISDTALTEPPP